ncbi:hypothetical protein GB931_03055 [Modestobacter sp. I12A-02628]|uniref:Glycosyltransferase family 9 protein n=1 Tax=Goekera deserti TaxID=2497753 RepID=A0A7K3WEK1_9ACTN|nr:glycosyltransferase family 9 protein [Goekera deserti]MPQ96917.1 hypothetical protein [Goekera deserti]NDI46770.1 hypothetical protein [Goekera deserti]NEL54339.1 glycosyltransferase family 9 protein [Goekera deserti]
MAVFARLWEPGLGDLMQRNILLHVIRRAHPEASLTLVLSRTPAGRFAEFLAAHTYATEVLECPDYGNDRPEEWQRFMTELSERRFDVCVVDPDSRGLGGEAADRAGVPVRIGYAVGHTGQAGLTTAIRIPRPTFGAPDLLDYAVSLRQALGLPAIGPSEVLPPPRYRRADGPVSTSPVVALHPGGAPHWNRRWPRSSFVDLAVGLADVAGSLLLVGSGEEQSELEDLGAAVTRRAPGLEIAISAGDSLNRLATLLAQAHVLVGSDSAPAHLAAALRVPTVVLYGPTATEFMWARVYPRHHGINLRYGCQQVRNLPRGPGTDTMPCAHGCTYPYLGPDGPYPRCLTDIPVDRVLTAARHHLPAPALLSMEGGVRS